MTIQSIQERFPWLMRPVVWLDTLLTPRRWRTVPDGAARAFERLLTPDTSRLARRVNAATAWLSRLRAGVLTAVTAVVLSASAGCSDGSGGDSGGEADLTAQKLDWKDCPAPSGAEGGGAAPSPLPDGDEWQCATMKAPLDWNDPRGDTIGVATAGHVKALIAAFAEEGVTTERLALHFHDTYGQGVGQRRRRPVQRA